MQALLLADEMKLDEVLAVMCVQGALQEVRVWQSWASLLTAAGGAGSRAAGFAVPPARCPLGLQLASKVAANSNFGGPHCSHPALLPAQTGEVSAAAGAGIYFEERRGLLTSLWLLLQAQVGTGRAASLGSSAAGQQAGAGRAARVHRLLCCCRGAARWGLFGCCMLLLPHPALCLKRAMPTRPVLTTSHPTAPSHR